MTPREQALTEAVMAKAPSAPQLDPISLTILLAIIGTLVSHIVEHCLEQLDHRKVRQPGPIRRLQLWMLCRRVASAEVQSPKYLGTVDTSRGTEFATHAYGMLLRYGAEVTEGEWAAMRAGA